MGILHAALSFEVVMKIDTLHTIKLNASCSIPTVKYTHDLMLWLTNWSKIAVAPCIAQPSLGHSFVMLLQWHA
jgi:hypothetical protein